MKKSLIALAALAVISDWLGPRRARTHDVAYAFRMGAGFPGTVNRHHPAAVVAGVQNVTTPVRRYGEAALIDTATNSWRGLAAADASDATPIVINGVLARDFPAQAATSAGNYGQQLLSDPTAAPTAGVLNYMDLGRILVKVRGAGALNLNSAVYVFCAADEAGHVLGGFETAAITGKTVKVSNARYRGPVDADGVTELELMAIAV